MDFTNVGNMFNSNWGIPQVEWQNNPLNLRRVGANGVPVYRVNSNPGTNELINETFRTSNSLGNLWRMQVGVRYIFN